MTQRFKGLVFKSWTDRSGTPPPSRMQWRSHTSTKAKLRNLYHACKPVLDATDSQTTAAVTRIAEAVSAEPMPQFGRLHLVFAAIEMAAETGESWPTCANYLMDKFDAMREGTDVPAAP
jgi:hypothetical protein